MGIFKSLGMSPNTFVPKGAKMGFNTSHNPNLARMRAQAELERRRAAASAASTPASTPASAASTPAKPPQKKKPQKK